MVLKDDTVGYCPKNKKWFLYNAEMKAMGVDKQPRSYYDSFDAAVMALKTIKDTKEIE
jgi:hypothetical protein